MPESKLSKTDHDRVVQYIAKNRFPFPDQADWPDDYRTITNAPDQQHPVPYQQQNVLPDIVVVDGSGEVREIGEVEVELKPQFMPRLMMASLSTTVIEGTDVQHFFLYVPLGMEDRARKMLSDYRISYAGLRAFKVDGQEISIVPVETPGHDKDHR